jgi:hypothetical protein
MFKKIVFLTILLLPILTSSNPFQPSESYTHKIIIDDEEPELYQLLWKINNNDEIIFEVHDKTTGWIGLGISSNGGMAG